MCIIFSCSWVVREIATKALILLFIRRVYIHFAKDMFHFDNNTDLISPGN